MDEGRKRVLAIVAGILVARHLNTADDLFGGPQGSPRTEAIIAAAVQWADRTMRKIDIYKGLVGPRVPPPQRGRSEQRGLLVQPSRQVRLPRTARLGMAQHRQSTAGKCLTELADATLSLSSVRFRVHIQTV